MSKTYLWLLAVDVEDSAFVVGSRCRRPTFCCSKLMLYLMLHLEFILYSKFTTHSKKIYKMSLYKFRYPFCIFFQIQTLIFQHWCERWIKAEISSASLNLCPSNTSYSQGETIKASFLSLSPSHWYHWLCRPNPVKLTPCGKKKHT
jgi:hypothetical protein